jgi:hypothetical protein
MARKLYTEKGDKKIDAKMLKKLTPAQKTAFEKADKKHKKVKYQNQDTKIDRKIIAKVKKQTKKK